MFPDVFPADDFIQDPSLAAPDGVRLLSPRLHSSAPQYRKQPFSCAGSVSSDWHARYRAQSERLIPPALLEVCQAEVRGHGLVTSQGGVLLTGRAICSANTLPQTSLWSCGKRLDRLLSVRPDNVVRVNAPLVLLMRPGDHIYGHWLVDILPKLVMVATFREKDWLYLLANSTPSYAFELLAAFGISREKCVLVDPHTQVVQARRLIISGALRQGNFMWPAAQESFNRLKARFYDPSITSPRRVFLKRPAHDPKRRLLNRSSIEGIFEAYEYQLVSPEKLTFREQFSLLARSTIIAAEAGSALHSSVVSDGGKVLELRSNSDGSFIQAGLCESCGQDIGYFIGEAIARPGIGREASWIANRDRLKSYLREIDCNPHDLSA